MTVPNSFAAGDVFFESSMEELALILEAAGIDVDVGQYKLTLFGSSGCFYLRYVGNLSPDAPFTVDFDGHGIPVSAIEERCDQLSTCLRKNAIRYDYAHFDESQEVIHQYTSQPTS